MAEFAATGPIGGDWVAHLDEGSGKTYYHNSSTNETTWEWPADIPKPDGGETPKTEARPSSGAWQEVVDPSSGKTYYHNSETNETTWEKPADFEGSGGGATSSGAAGGASSSDDADPSKVAANWSSKFDSGTSKVYYFNIVTNETTWERPACMGEDTEGSSGQDPHTSSTESSSEAADSARQSEVADKLAALKQMTITDEDDEAAGDKSGMSSGRAEDISNAMQQALRGEEDAGDSSSGGLQLDSAYSLLLKVTDKKATRELTADVEDVTYIEYAEKYFNYDRKGIFNTRTTTEKITSWKGGKDVIKTSLLQLNDRELQSEAVQCFRNITGFMGDRTTNKPAMDHCIKLLTYMLQSMEDLRNEIFCQIAKQTKNNPSLDSVVTGWQLLIICLAVAPPGQLLKDHLMAYCAENMRNAPDPRARKYAEYALHCIPMICELGSRKDLPTPVEIEACRRMAPVSIRVNFLDDKYLNLPVHSWTTAKQMNAVIAMRLNIKDPKPFSIFEVSSRDEERVVDDDERILDLVAYWTRLQNEERAKKGKHADVEEFKFVYKVRLFFDVNDEDLSAVEMMYIQATHDVVDARYPCSEQDSITLAALQVQEQFGDHPGSSCSHITGKVTKYLAQKYTETTSETELEEQILQLYSKLTGYSKQEARLSYLDYVRSWKIYGSSYYFAEPQNNRDFPPEVVLAINSKAILVVDPESKEYLQEYPYSQVVTWGHSPNSFVVVTGNMLKQVKIYFKTDQGKEMNQVVLSYVEHLLELQKGK